MDHLSDLNVWKESLDKIEPTDYKVNLEDLRQLEKLFKHLPTQTAPRLQKEYEACTVRSDQLFSNLFDKIDLSDKVLLCCHLQMLRSFAFFRLAQIVYHVPRTGEESDSIYSPIIVKAKWHELYPLLPEAGTIGWKAIMNHGIVKDETQLLATCLQLLSQKLQFLAIVGRMNRFQDYTPVIYKNGKKVGEKLFELIRDVAYDDSVMIGLDASLFNLLLPFTDQDQQAAIIDAAVEDLFKPHLLQTPIAQEEIDKIYDFIHNCVMNKVHLQDILFAKLLQHLKCNVKRRKRRHSVEASEENNAVTIESLLSEIGDSKKLKELLPQTVDYHLSAKSLQSGYISYWISVVNEIVSHGPVTALTSLKVVSTCSILLVSGSEVISTDLIHSLSLLMTKTIENTAQCELDRLFNVADQNYMIEFTRKLFESDKIISIFDSSLQQFYDSYLNRYLRACIVRSAKKEAMELTSFVTFICDKSLNKDAAHLLQCIVIHQLANCLKNFKVNNQIMETYLECARICSKRLYKFIKKHSPLQLINDESGEDTNPTHLESEPKKMDALICILTIAIERKDQEMLDQYGDLIIKLFSFMTTRLGRLAQLVKVGAPGTQGPLDPHLPNLLLLYMRHKDVLKVYLNYDLIQSIASILVLEESTLLNGCVDEMKINKKLVYNQIKTKLEALEVRANQSMDVYPTIINKHHSTIEQSITSLSDIKKENSCCHNYWQQMRSINLVSAITLSHCDLNVYKKVLDNTVHWLEHCDPLDHPRVLYLLIMLEPLIPSSESNERFNMFRNALTRISCSFIRITKSVELGPSIHAFTRSGTHKSSSSIQCCTYSNCIKIYTAIFLKFSPKVLEPIISDAMEICVSSNPMQYAKQHSKYFIQLGGSIAVLLKSLCKKNEKIANTWMPIFITVLSLLTRCLILASEKHNHKNTKDFELLALDVGRTLYNLSYLKVKFVDYAPHLISSYIKDIQRASCPDFVRLHLNEGIFRIFNLIDAHQKERQEDLMEAGIQRKTNAGRASGSLFEMIHARLDQASREIFRDLHDDYNRFHRYLAKC